MMFQDLVRAMQAHFPNINGENFRPTSPPDEGYNCIAWAAEDTENWWEPDAGHQLYWPPQIPREYSIDAYTKAYGVLGYTERTDASVEPAKQKIAIYVGSDGKPTHAARQLPDGWWASKLGQQIDIEHDLSALDGPAYGTVAVILSRPAK